MPRAEGGNAGDQRLSFSIEIVFKTADCQTAVARLSQSLFGKVLAFCLCGDPDVKCGLPRSCVSTFDFQLRYCLLFVVWFGLRQGLTTKP